MTTKPGPGDLWAANPQQTQTATYTGLFTVLSLDVPSGTIRCRFVAANGYGPVYAHVTVAAFGLSLLPIIIQGAVTVYHRGAAVGPTP